MVTSFSVFKLLGYSNFFFFPMFVFIIHCVIQGLSGSGPSQFLEPHPPLCSPFFTHSFMLLYCDLVELLMFFTKAPCFLSLCKGCLPWPFRSWVGFMLSVTSSGRDSYFHKAVRWCQMFCLDVPCADLRHSTLLSTL